MTAETKWPGVFVKKADPLVLADLQERGLLFSAPQFTHDYPFCWRCDTPLLYYARPTWFIRMTALKDNLVRNNRTINWMPENIKEGRMATSWITSSTGDFPASAIGARRCRSGPANAAMCTSSAAARSW